jgi:hypothetical protein
MEELQVHSIDGIVLPCKQVLLVRPCCRAAPKKHLDAIYTCVWVCPLKLTPKPFISAGLTYLHLPVVHCSQDFSALVAELLALVTSHLYAATASWTAFSVWLVHDQNHVHAHDSDRSACSEGI